MLDQIIPYEIIDDLEILLVFLDQKLLFLFLRFVNRLSHLALRDRLFELFEVAQIFDVMLEVLIAHLEKLLVVVHV